MSDTRIVKRAGLFASVAAVLLVAGCARPHYLITAAPEVRTQGWASSRLTPHVLLVSVDGLRPDAIQKFDAPTLQRLMREGSYSLAATTITPSKTLPSHTSMLTGQPPETHGVLWNNVLTADAEIVEVPTVFAIARARGYQTAAFFSKSKFEPLQQPGTLDYSQAPGGWFGRWDSDRTVADVAKHFADHSPNLTFVHLSDPDRAGHDSGWMSADYGRAVATTDRAIGNLVAAAESAFGEGNYTIIVTADHGGHDRDHGSDDPQDVLIPWIAWGRGVKPGELDAAPVRTMDTASTVLWLLGVEEPDDWAGSPVVRAFESPAAVD